MNILFLDDDIIRHRSLARDAKQLGANIVSSYNLFEFRQCLKEKYNVISFDYDLGPEKGTEAVDILHESNYNKNVFCAVHSAHADGSEKIINKLISGGYNRVAARSFSRDWLKKIIYMANL